MPSRRQISLDSLEAGSLSRARGRPLLLSRGEVDECALKLFVERGFEQTTVMDVAEALNVSRRTLFRHFRSKNDMVWGDFDSVLDRLRRELAATPRSTPLIDAIAAAAVESNRYPADELPALRIRMTLITTVPALQAHSMLRYAAWRDVVAEFAAGRLRCEIEDIAPQAIAHAALGTAVAAFVCWTKHPETDLSASLARGYRLLTSGFSDGA